MQKIVDGLQKHVLSFAEGPRAEKRYDKLLERIGRLKAKSRGASQHYTINMTKAEDSELVEALAWEKSAVPGTMATHPGVYCLRSNELSWDEEKLWHTPDSSIRGQALYHVDGLGKRIPQPEG